MTDAMAAKPLHVEITGELCDTETVMHSLEGGDWKSTCQGNSLVAYPTARPVLKTIVGGDSGDKFNLPDVEFREGSLLLAVVLRYLEQLESGN